MSSEEYQYGWEDGQEDARMRPDDQRQLDEDDVDYVRGYRDGFEDYAINPPATEHNLYGEFLVEQETKDD